MSKRLILTRHAKSSWDEPLPDHDRPLNARGHKSAPAIGDWLRSMGYVPDEILSSTARRTMQTCEGLGFDAIPQFLSVLYHASAETIETALCHGQGNCILLVGHNPGIAEFAHRIVKTPPSHRRFNDYPTCATTVIDFKIKRWDELSPHSGRVKDFKIPREL